MNKKMTQEKVDLCISLYNDGYSSYDISKKLDVCKRTILVTLYKNNITIKDRSYYNKFNSEQIIKLLKEKKSIEEIAKALKCNKKQILSFCYRNHLNPYQDKIGKNFNYLTIIDYKNKNFICKCVCGQIVNIKTFNHLTRNIRQSCGCTHDSTKNKAWTGYNELSGSYLYVVQYNAKKRNIEYNITSEYLWSIFVKQNNQCALSGIVLEFGGQTPKTASLDRIDSSKGYIEGNVQWVHKDVNLMKNNFNESYFLEMCKLIANK